MSGSKSGQAYVPKPPTPFEIATQSNDLLRFQNQLQYELQGQQGGKFTQSYLQSLAEGQPDVYRAFTGLAQNVAQKAQAPGQVDPRVIQGFMENLSAVQASKGISTSAAPGGGVDVFEAALAKTGFLEQKRQDDLQFVQNYLTSGAARPEALTPIVGRPQDLATATQQTQTYLQQKAKYDALTKSQAGKLGFFGQYGDILSAGAAFIPGVGPFISSGIKYQQGQDVQKANTTEYGGL